MDMLLLLAAALGFAWAKKKDQSERIALLGSVLSRFDIEKLMESLTDGYLRAFDEETQSARPRSGATWKCRNKR